MLTFENFHLNLNNFTNIDIIHEWSPKKLSKKLSDLNFLFLQSLMVTCIQLIKMATIIIFITTTALNLLVHQKCVVASDSWTHEILTSNSSHDQLKPRRITQMMTTWLTQGDSIRGTRMAGHITMGTIISMETSTRFPWTKTWVFSLFDFLIDLESHENL